MNTPRTSKNDQRLGQLRAILDAGLDEALRRGFHGTLAVELNVEDGTIRETRLRTEWVAK